MKKKIFAILCAAVLSCSFALSLTGCGGDSYAKASFPEQDTSYAVESQGGSAVSYGNYIYFINGTRGYEDTDGKQNLYGDTVKGGLYRAELNGTKVNATDTVPYATFKPVFDVEKQHEFKSSEGKDYDENPIDIVDVTPIAKKTIGTSGYADGGIFIYENYVFFASPYNQKNNLGTVESSRTDFFAQRLSGGTPVKIYTSKAETASAAYSFYYYKGAVYLNVFESPNIISVKFNLSSNKASDPNTIKANATSVYFPVRDTYYHGIDNNTPADFIYYVRNVDTDKDNIRSGTVLETMRPDGSENIKLIDSRDTLTIESVDENMVFYREAVTTTSSSSSSTVTTLRFNNFRDSFYEHSATYKAAEDSKTVKTVQTKETSFTTPTNISVDGISSTLAFSVDNSNTVYLLVANGSGISLYNQSGLIRQVIDDGSVTIDFTINNNSQVIYHTSNEEYVRINIFTPSDKEMLTDAVTTAGITFDYCKGYIMYFTKLDEWAADYSFFKLIEGREGVEAKFVGIRAKADIKPEDDEDDDE